MPLINVKMIEGVFTPTQKQEMIRKLTDTIVAWGGQNFPPVRGVFSEGAQRGWGGMGRFFPPHLRGVCRCWRSLLGSPPPSAPRPPHPRGSGA